MKLYILYMGGEFAPEQYCKNTEALFSPNYLCVLNRFYSGFFKLLECSLLGFLLVFIEHFSILISTEALLIVLINCFICFNCFIDCHIICCLLGAVCHGCITLLTAQV